MKFLYSAILAMATTALSSPLEEREVQVAHLTFHGGPASYELAVPADGTVVQTSKPYPMFIRLSTSIHTHIHTRPYTSSPYPALSSPTDTAYQDIKQRVKRLTNPPSTPNKQTATYPST